MPLILAIESSTPRASLALVSGEECLFEASFASDRNHHAALFAPLGEACARLEGETLERVLVGTGPGSYSGTRVGIAAAQGVAMVHDCPAVGLSSLLATPVPAGTAIGDARRGMAWWARVGGGDDLPDPRLVPADGLAAHLVDPVFAIDEVGGLTLPDGLELHRVEPSARRLAMAWWGLDEATRHDLGTTPLQPAYVAPPHITAAKRGHPLVRKRDRA